MKNANFTYSEHNSLIQQLERHIAANLDNEQFGVEQLAKMISLSRSQLHRKLKKTNGKSISQFIREYRLKKALELLVTGEFNTSEVADKVGFGSASYFSKCFTDYFGYPPSMAKERESSIVLPLNEDVKTQSEHKSSEKRYYNLFGIVLFLAIVLTLFFFLNKSKTSIKTDSKTVLVLPFKNLSNNADNQYIAEGMVDAINRHLSAIEELNILSSAALDPTKERNEALTEIGDRYPNSNVLQGSLQQEGNTLRIEVKLVNATNNEQLWAENYDRESDNLLVIQNDIAKKIANTLQAKLTPGEEAIIDKQASYSPEAYDNYLKGMYNMNHIGENGMDQSLVYFKKAIEIDSFMAPAYAAIANFYQMKASIFSASIDSKEAFQNAENYLDLAIKLDKDWHFNYSTKAFQMCFFHWNFEEADRNHKIGIKANKPLNYIMYRDFLQSENRHEEALDISLIIDKETPFYPNSPLIFPYYYNGMYEEGRSYIEERLIRFPTNYLTLDNAGFFMLNTGDYERAIEIFQTLIETKGKRFPRALSWMGSAYAHKGETKKARELLKELKDLKLKTDAGSPAWFAAIIHSALGEKKEALEWLTMAINDHEMEVPWLVSEPQFYPLHGLQEFDELVKRVGFRPHAYPVKN